MGFRESEPPQERDAAPISDAGEQISDAAAAIQLAPVVANIPGIVYQRRLSPDGTLSIPFISDGVRDVWGYSPQEVMANPSLLIDAIKPSSRAHYEEATVASAETLCLWMVEVEVTAKDGATRWVRGKAQPRREDDGSIIWDGLIVDITSEKALEAQLNERDGMLAQAKRLTSLGYFAFDIESRKIWWSEETYRLYGANAETFDGSEAALLDRIHMEDRDRVAEARRRCAEAGEPWDMEYRITREDGGERVLHSVCEAELQHGRIVRMAGTVQDVTERAHKEAELKQSESDARESRGLLADVVESVTDGFAVFDADNKLILFSQAYRDMFPKVAPLIKVGARFHDLIDAARKTGQFLMTPAHEESFTEWRLAKQGAGEPFELQLDTGRWIEVRDRLLPDGTRLSTRVDITDARKAEGALRESETRLADAQRIASIGNFERHIVTGEVTWSDNQYVIFGVDSATFDHQHQSVLSFVLPEDQAVFMEANSRAIEQGEPWDLHYRIRRADGAIRTIHSMGEAVFEDGVAVYLRGVTQDVTESRQAEEDLRQSVERFDLVIRATSDGVFDWNIESGTCWFSANSRAIFGYDRTGHEGSIEEWRVRIHPSDRSMVSEAMELQFAGGDPYNVEYRFLRADGVWRWFQSFGVLQRDDDGKPIRMVGSNRDVSERRQADERFRVLFERSTDPHLLVDQKGIIDCNRATLEMLGCTDQESLVGQHPAELSPEQQPDGRISLEKAKEMDALARARGFHRYEWTHQRFDGEEFLVETTMSPVALDSGPALLVVWHDISVRKRTEDALRDAKDAAEHADKAKSDFLASMSHEIRTPLNGVIGMLGLMMRGKLDDTQRDQAEVARQSAESLLSLINDILDVSKLEAGRVNIEHIDFDLLEVVSGVAELLGPRAKEGGNVIEVNYAPDVPADIGSDPTKIRQVLFNLVGNAIKFTHEGTVSINVMCTARSDKGAKLRIEISDTGIGIDPDARDTLFEKFAQADASISRRYGGTGLGLSICRMLLEALGGGIGVDSELGVGSTFWFEIPVSVSSVVDVAIRDAGDEPDNPVDGTSLANYKILLAEDNLINQQIAVTLLVDAGADVDTALNGNEVVAMAPLEPYDIVLMDIRMPELDGVEATKRIRALGGSCAEVPIVAMTANAMSGDQDTYLAAGMNDYISKPLAFGKLFRTLLKWAPSAGHVEAGALLLTAKIGADDADGDATTVDNTVVEVLANAGTKRPVEAPDIDETVIAGLETALGPQKVKDLVGLQIKTARELLTILRTGVESSDDDQVIGAAHDLKSTFGQFGALDASAAAAVIEEGFRSGDFDRSGDGIARCLSLSERAVGALAARYSLSDAA